MASRSALRPRGWTSGESQRRDRRGTDGSITLFTTLRTVRHRPCAGPARSLSPRWRESHPTHRTGGREARLRTTYHDIPPTWALFSCEVSAYDPAGKPFSPTPWPLSHSREFYAWRHAPRVKRLSTCGQGIPLRSAPATSTGDGPARFAPGRERQKFCTMAQALTGARSLIPGRRVGILNSF